MFAATIVPQPYLHLTEGDPYHLALAHLINKPGFEDYTKFYTDIGKSQDKYLIMDNGLIEGDPRPIEELLAKAEQIFADELVLPDVFEDSEATLTQADAAMDFLVGRGTNIRKMVVPQGEDYTEWLECAKEMLTWPIDCIGIPKVLTKLAGRDGRLLALMELQQYLGDVEVHLLGCWDSPLEIKMIENVIRAGKIKPVRGVDSAIAYVYARAGLKMCDAERPEGKIDFAAEDADMGSLMFNIGMWKSECAELPPLGGTSNLHKLFL